VRLLGQNVALADSKLTHGWAGGQLIFPEVIMSMKGDAEERRIERGAALEDAPE
jgi:hypothetical protein